MNRARILLVAAATAILGITAFTSQQQEPATAVTLGRTLFFDPLLSRNRTLSCASCHREQFAFADTSAVSTGVFGRKGTRNTLSAMNVALQSSLFWDGRASTLEMQALMPIANADEMNLPVDSAVARLNASAFYRAYFRRVYGRQPDQKALANALASFESSLEAGESPFDDWRMNDNEAAVSEPAKRGFVLFQGKANCIHCHFGPDFNNTDFRNIGLFDGRQRRDSGRAAVTKKASDLGRFKIGPLRNIALTAPYMHDGSFKSLREVIDYYDDPDRIVPQPINRDPLLNKPLGLTEQEKTDLESFLRSLTDKRFGAPKGKS